MSNLKLAHLPTLNWQGEIPDHKSDPDCQALTVSAPPGSDLFNHHSGVRQSGAAACLFEAEGDLSFSARVSLEHGGQFDAGAILIWGDDDHWAKLCLEVSPAGENSVVSVVTNRYSDDANGVTFDRSWTYLRISRRGGTWAFHYSDDGELWHLNRVFRMAELEGPVQLGFAAQAPSGGQVRAGFEQIIFNDLPPSDIRSGQ